MAQPAAPAPAAAPMPDALKTPQAQVGYAFGLRIGAQMRTMAVDIDPQALALGVRDALAGSTPLLTPAQIGQVMAQAQSESETRRAALDAKAAVGNRAAGAAFLKANAAKPGVVTLPSGLQYQVITAGSGPRPKSTDTVSSNYRGTLIDGTEFDSSASHGGPIDFPVTGVIKGWTEALQLMPVGSKWRLFVPADLAYGDKGAPPVIQPGSTLIFEVELVKIK
jgi:FKBP-type peptidyl-prolyl cis-trans isomerase FklB